MSVADGRSLRVIEKRDREVMRAVVERREARGLDAKAK